MIFFCVLLLCAYSNLLAMEANDEIANKITNDDINMVEATNNDVIELNTSSEEDDDRNVKKRKTNDVVELNTSSEEDDDRNVNATTTNIVVELNTSGEEDDDRNENKTTSDEDDDRSMDETTSREDDEKDDGYLNDEKLAEATNLLIELYRAENRIWDKIKCAVGNDEFSMETLTFMFALPEQDIQDNYIKQFRLQTTLQQDILLEATDCEDTKVQVLARVNGLKSMQVLANERRAKLKKILRLLIIDIIAYPMNHKIDFIHTCRIIGMFMSTKFPTAYTKAANVLPEDETCVLDAVDNTTRSYKYFGLFIYAVDNETRAFRRYSLVSELR